MGRPSLRSFRSRLPGDNRISLGLHFTLRQPAFDHGKFAAALSEAAHHEYKGDHLPISNLEFSDDAKTLKFEAADKTWKCDLDSYKCMETGGSGGANTFVPDSAERVAAGDLGRWRARI